MFAACGWTCLSVPLAQIPARAAGAALAAARACGPACAWPSDPPGDRLARASELVRS